MSNGLSTGPLATETPPDLEEGTSKKPHQDWEQCGNQEKNCPVKAEGHHLRTFINTVQEEFWHLKPTGLGKTSQRNLTTKEQKAL